jgi:hypothetical protein
MLKQCVFRCRKADFALTIMGTIYLLCCNPAFVLLKALLDERNNGIVESIPRSIFSVQRSLELFSRGAMTLEREDKELKRETLQILNSSGKVSSTINELLLILVDWFSWSVCSEVSVDRHSGRYGVSERGNEA